MAQDVHALAQQFIDALHALEEGDAGNVDGIVALFSDDTLLTNSALILAGDERRGSEGARAFWTEYRGTFATARSDFHQITENDEAAGLFWKTTGTDNVGQALDYDGVSLLVFDDTGKIKHFHGYYDTRQLSRTMPSTS